MDVGTRLSQLILEACSWEKKRHLLLRPPHLIWGWNALADRVLAHSATCWLCELGPFVLFNSPALKKKKWWDNEMKTKI